MFALILKLAPWLMKAAPLLGMAKGKAKLIGSILTVLSVLGTYWYINALQNDVSELEGQAILYVEQILECQAANSSMVDSILELRDANSSLAESIEVTAEAREQAAREAYRRDQLAHAALLVTKQELEDLRNANPTCQQLSQIDMGIACPAVIERLRNAADPDYED